MVKEYTNFDKISNRGRVKSVRNTSLKNRGHLKESFCFHLSTSKTYKSKEYLENGNLGADGLYGFHNIVLPDIASGLSFEYGVHENYSDDAELKVLQAFVKHVALENLKLLI